ncbi:hypothetical protein DRO66_11940 [Candidatus Bathyarchaeota archaeon]|nr:MAG: hypothetical protein DRO66_11940 [Candidatus Bathyarchaeota archaeon]
MITKVSLKDKKLIPFLFAGYRKIPDPRFPVIDVTFYAEGNWNIPDILRVHGESKKIILFTERTADLILEDREQILDFLKEKFKIRTRKSVDNRINKLSDQEFFDFVRYTCVRRKWALEVFKRSESMYRLFKASSEGTVPFLRTLFKIEADGVPIQVLFSSFVTFLYKVSQSGELPDSVSKGYKLQISKARAQFSQKIPEALTAAVYGKGLPTSIRIVSFFLNLRS